MARDLDKIHRLPGLSEPRSALVLVLVVVAVVAVAVVVFVVVVVVVVATSPPSLANPLKPPGPEDFERAVRVIFTQDPSGRTWCGGETDQGQVEKLPPDSKSFSQII